MVLRLLRSILRARSQAARLAPQKLVRRNPRNERAAVESCGVAQKIVCCLAHTFFSAVNLVETRQSRSVKSNLQRFHNPRVNTVFLDCNAHHVTHQLLVPNVGSFYLNLQFEFLSVRFFFFPPSELSAHRGRKINVKRGVTRCNIKYNRPRRGYSAMLPRLDFLSFLVFKMRAQGYYESEFGTQNAPKISFITALS